jgi:hypothetical protein
MTPREVRVFGELYLSLETVAEIYRVQEVWLRGVYEHGLLGTGVDDEVGICIPAARLDRVATIVRMHRVLELDLDTITLTLGGSREA